MTKEVYVLECTFREISYAGKADTKILEEVLTLHGFDSSTIWARYAPSSAGHTAGTGRGIEQQFLKYHCSLLFKLQIHTAVLHVLLFLRRKPRRLYHKQPAGGNFARPGKKVFHCFCPLFSKRLQVFIRYGDVFLHQRFHLLRRQAFT